MNDKLMFDHPLGEVSYRRSESSVLRAGPHLN